METIESLKAENDRLKAEIDDLMELGDSFRNFHRLLCERFEYGHDPVDWRRDQLSLIEHIAKAVPEQQSPAAAVSEPSKIDVYRWFQESTITHHIEEDGAHISKRAMFLAKKAIAFAQKSPRITEQDAREIALSFYWFVVDFKHKLEKTPSIIEWNEAEGRALLAKLNGVAE